MYQVSTMYILSCFCRASFLQFPTKKFFGRSSSWNHCNLLTSRRKPRLVSLYLFCILRFEGHCSFSSLSEVRVIISIYAFIQLPWKPRRCSSGWTSRQKEISPWSGYTSSFIIGRIFSMQCSYSLYCIRIRDSPPLMSYDCSNHAEWENAMVVNIWWW